MRFLRTILGLERRGPEPTGCGVEPLESRQLLSAVYTPEVVYFTELVNRARLDPAAEEVRLGIDLREQLTDDELAMFGPVEPLALDASLSVAALAHSMDMASRAFFDHINPDGLNPTQRAQAAGYSGVAGEVISSGPNSIDALYESWMTTVENRVNLLSLIPTFNLSFHYDHIGAGFLTDVGWADDHFTAMFGDPGAGTSAWLLGVVYDDVDNDGFYTIGEGSGNVRVDVAAAALPRVTVATYTTNEAGNYQLKLGDGSWIVTFTDTSTGEQVQKLVETDGENVKLDTLADELETPADGGGDDGSDDGGGGGGSSDGDDHADDGDYANATRIELDPETGGLAWGEVAGPTDTDLFYFTAGSTGELRVTLDAAGGELVGSLTLKSDAGIALAIERSDTAGEAVTLVWYAVERSQYFLVVGSVGGATQGGYSLAVEVGGDDDGSGDDGGDDGDGDGGGDDGGDGGGDGGGDDGGDGDQDPEDDTPPIDATSDGSGSFTIVRTNSAGHPVVYLQQDDGSWTRVDLLAEVGGPLPEGRFSTFVNPDTGLPVIVSAASSGLVIYSLGQDGQWGLRSLSAEKGAAPIVSKPVTFKSGAGRVHIAGLDSDGNLVTYYQDNSFDRLGRAWAYEDITTDHLAAQGRNMPSLRGGTLISYVTGWNALTIAGLDERGRVFAAWRAPGMEQWSLSNLSAITGAPVYEGTISAYLTPWNGINIAGTDENGDLSVVWWVPSFGGEWRLSKLNRVLDGPKLTEGTIASWVTPWGGLNVSGLTAEGRVAVYWWTPGSGGWQITSLSDAIRGVEPPVRGVIGHTSQTGVISIMGLSWTGDLVRYWWEAGSPWRGEVLRL